jgi:surfeit locus 1 family protein
MTLLTIVLIALLISLGRWQLRRAGEKQVLFDSFAAGTDATQRIDLATPHLRRYQHVEAGGHYDQARQILIDNMVNTAGRAGYFVITPFALAGGGWVLVNRGWVPLGASRAERPPIAVAGDARQVRGRADNMPSPGIQMGTKAELAPPYPVVAGFPSHGEIAGCWANPPGPVRRIWCCSTPASPTATHAIGQRPDFRRCATSAMRCSGSPWR